MNKAFTKPYPSGWKELPDETTPVNASVMTGYDNAIDTIDNRVIQIKNDLCDLEYNENHGGANIWNEEWELGDLGTQGENVANSTMFRSKNYIQLKPSTTYFFYSDLTNGNNTVFFYDTNKAFISFTRNVKNATFTTPSNAKYMRFYATQNTTYNGGITIVEGSTETEYKPYIPSVKMLAEDVDELNANLDNKTKFTFILGDIKWADGSDLSSTTWKRSSIYIKVAPNTNYTLSRSKTEKLNIVGYKSDKIVISDGITPTSALVAGATSKVVEFTTSATTEYIRIGINDTDLTEVITITNNGIGNTVVELVEDVTQIKDSLDDYGLVNKFDGQAKQGYYNTSSGAFVSDNNNVCCANKISCEEGQNIHIKINKSLYFRVVFYNASGSVVGSNLFNDRPEVDFECVAIANAKYFTFYASSNGSSIPTVEEAKSYRVYVDNAIDELKNDLIVTKTVKVTTDSNGNASLDMSLNNFDIVGVSGGSTCCSPFWYSNDWYVHAFTMDSSMSIVANQEIYVMVSYRVRN